MNLDSFQLIDEPLEMTVAHPVTGEPTDAVLLLWSPYAAPFLQRKESIARSMLQAALQNKEDGDMELRLTAATIAGWRGLTREGREMIYTQATAEDVLHEYPWLREQVVFFYNDASKFFRTPQAA